MASHDLPFLASIGITRWLRLSPGGRLTEGEPGDLAGSPSPAKTRSRTIHPMPTPAPSTGWLDPLADLAGIMWRRTIIKYMFVSCVVMVT